METRVTLAMHLLVQGRADCSEAELQRIASFLEAPRSASWIMAMASLEASFNQHKAQSAPGHQHMNGS